jgi:hypothetical protein
VSEFVWGTREAERVPLTPTQAGARWWLTLPRPLTLAPIQRADCSSQSSTFSWAEELFLDQVFG